jgi:hypothetical protein
MNSSASSSFDVKIPVCVCKIYMLISLGLCKIATRSAMHGQDQLPAMLGPSATRMAPVSVARSIICNNVIGMSQDYT